MNDKGDTVLIIDDNKTNIEVLISALESQGFRIITARSGEMGIRRAEFSRPDLILLDVLMPGMDGFETCHRLKAGDRTGDIPVMFMTALTDMENKLRGFEVGGVDYITKPFEEAEVLVRVKTHLTLRNMQKKLRKEIAERMQAEMTLRESEERFRTIFENAPVMISSFDEAGRCRLWNRQCEETLGYSEHEMKDCDEPLSLFYPDPSVRNHVLRDISEADGAFRERRVRRRDGDVRFQLWANFRLPNNASISVGHDITDQKKNETDLQVAKEAAEAANKAKSIFLANMSHELRTPLNAILGFSQLSARHPDIPTEVAENLGIVCRSGDHLLTLINQVLNLSKIEAGRTTLDQKDFDFHRLLDDLEDMFRLRAGEKNLQLLFERSPDLPRFVRTDEVKLRQVLINLLNNAIKFTTEGGVALRIGTKSDSGNKTAISSTSHF